ncbi:MAG: phage late control D family protein [Nitrospira sp.]
MAGLSGRQLLSPAFEVLINGQRLPQADCAYVSELEVDVSVTLPSMFTLALGGADTQREDVPWLDEERFAIGRSIEVKLGYENELSSVLKGEITCLESEFSTAHRAVLRVSGYDRRHRLMRGTKTRTFVQMKDSDIAGQIASEANLRPDVVDSKIRHDYLLQNNQTNMEFLGERARLIHYELSVDDRTLHFRPVANTDREAVKLTMERDLLAFYPRLSSCQQVSTVTVRGWNPKDKRKIIGHAGSGDEESRMGGEHSDTSSVPTAFGRQETMVVDRPVMTQEEADALAKSRYNKIGLTLIRGDGICWGRPDLHPGTVIKVEGVGKRFGGQYYVTSVVHRYSPHRGYHTHFEFERNAS